MEFCYDRTLSFTHTCFGFVNVNVRRLALALGLFLPCTKIFTNFVFVNVFVKTYFLSYVKASVTNTAEKNICRKLFLRKRIPIFGDFLSLRKHDIKYVTVNVYHKKRKRQQTATFTKFSPNIFFPSANETHYNYTMGINFSKDTTPHLLHYRTVSLMAN